jgi:DNA (cytosine-5)-methyltransferase 1
MSSDNVVVSLFAGAGGFSTGFSQAGLKPIFGAEIDADACKSYEQNVGSPCHRLDLSTVEPDYIHKLAGDKRPFAVIGGPPCQGFSTAGPRNASDPRNKLIFNYLNIVAKLAPRWFIFENVEGLLTSGGGKDLTRLVREFVGMGYSIRLQKVNLASYGVPQTRKRVLIIGNCLGVNFNFPEEVCSFDSGKARKSSALPMAPTLEQAIAGLGIASSTKGSLVAYSPAAHAVNDFDALMRAGNSTGTVTRHVRAEPSEKMQVALLKPGQTMKDLPPELWHESYKRRANRRVSDGTPTEKRGGAPSGIKRLHGNLQSLTITGAASREFIHPVENRPLTIRECARIQTFPDQFDWVGNNASVVQQIGNAVPPLAAERLAKHLQTIDGAFGSGLQADVADPSLLGFVLTESYGMSPALKMTEGLLAELHRENKTLDECNQATA